MFEADIHLRLCHTSILDIYKVFEPLVCCLKGIWVHPYTIPPSKLAPDFDFGVQVQLWSKMMFLHHYTGQVSPRFWDSGSLVE